MKKGKKVWSCELDIYGEVRKFTGDKRFIPFRYQAQYEDVETELYYNRFRYYSPDSGCYISQDPIGLKGNNPNIYAYVSDSNSWIDVFGLSNTCSIVSLDNNTLIDAIEKELKERVIKAINGRKVIVSVRAVKEFLFKGIKRIFAGSWW